MFFKLTWVSKVKMRVDCSCRSPEFSFQNSCWVAHNCLQLQLQGNLVPSMGTCTGAHTHTHTQKRGGVQSSHVVGWRSQRLQRMLTNLT